MSGVTAYWKLQQLMKNDKLSDNSYKFTQADRKTIDFALNQGSTAHVHTGDALAPSAPDTGPELTLNENQGSIPNSRTMYYRYTYVLSNGLESLPSPESSISTGSPVLTPGAPTLASQDAVSGSLPPGQYQYMLSAYKTSNTLETVTGAPFAIAVPGPNSLYKFCLTLPTLPTGGTGFNVFRRKAAEGDFYYMGSIDMDVATPPTTWCDDGSVTANQARTPATQNSTGNNSSVTVSLPGATPALPDDYVSWKIYRTFYAGNYSNSMLHDVVEMTVEPVGPVITYFEDLGGNASAGSYPQYALTLTQPQPVQHTDMAEAQGYLPVGRNLIPYEVDFTYSGMLALTDEATPQPNTLTKLWTCEFQYAEIVSIRAVLGKDSAPASDPVICDVLKYNCDHATPAWESLYWATTPNDKPTVEVGTFCGVRSTPNVSVIGRDDILRVDIEQIGGGATPTDEDLTVTVYMLVRDTRGDDTTSETGILGLS